MNNENYYINDPHEGVSVFYIKTFKEYDNNEIEYKTLYGLIDESKNIIIPPKYDDIYSCSEGMLGYCINDRYGFINKEGKEIIPAIYKNVNRFNNGLAIVQNTNLKYGAIDKTGKEIIPFKYFKMQNFNSGLVWVKVEINSQKVSKYGAIDKSGKEVIPFIYDDIYNFYDNVAPVKLNKKWFLINKNNEKISKEYNYIDKFINGYAIITLDDKDGIIDSKGNEIVPPIMNCISFDTCKYL